MIPKRYKFLYRDLLKTYNKQQSFYYQVKYHKAKARKMVYPYPGKKKPFAGPPTLQNELYRLKRKVARITPGLNYFTRTATLSSSEIAPFSYHVVTVTPTEDFIADAAYRTLITGDDFLNKFIKLKYTGNTTVIQQVRIVVYVPMKPTTLFQPQSDASGFVTIPDPNAFRVLYDSMKVNPNSLQPLHWQHTIQLRNLMTVYNGSSSTIEKGNLKICVMYQNLTDELGGVLGWQLVTQDK